MEASPNCEGRTSADTDTGSDVDLNAGDTGSDTDLNVGDSFISPLLATMAQETVESHNSMILILQLIVVYICEFMFITPV